MRKKFTALVAAALLAATTPLLAACSNGTSPVNTSAEAGLALTLNDGWAKSADAAGMTGVFGTLVNDGDSDIVLTSVESNVAGMVELHEVTTEGVMQEIAGDVVIPAQGSFELAPGANHIMLMALNSDLLAGDEVSFTLHYTSSKDSGLSAAFTVLVKDYAGANEDYGGEHGEHTEHSHDEHSHDEAEGEHDSH